MIKFISKRKQKLIERAIERIEDDFNQADITAIEILLSNISNKNLKAYIN